MSDQTDEPEEVQWFLCRTKDGAVLDTWTEPAPVWPVERTDLPDPSIVSFRGVEKPRSRRRWWRRLTRR